MTSVELGRMDSKKVGKASAYAQFDDEADGGEHRQQMATGRTSDAEGTPSDAQIESWTKGNRPNTFDSLYSWPSRFGFFYMSDFIARGVRVVLQEDALPDLEHDDYAKHAATIFDYCWRKQLEKDKPSLFRALLHCYGWWFVRVGLWKVPQDVLVFAGPVILKMLIAFCDTDLNPEPTWSGGLTLVFTLTACMLVQSVCLHRYFDGGYRLSMHVRAGLSACVFKKSLELSNDARAETTQGEIVNLMSTDSQKMMDTIPYLHNLVWSAVFQISVSMVLLYGYVGVSCFAGLAVMIAIIPINSLLMRKLRAIQEKNMGNKDERVKIIKEMLGGMRVIKFFAWEKPVASKIQEKRDAEVSALRRFAILSSMQNIFWSSAPVTVSIATFGVYGALGNPLTLEIVFPALAVFNIMRFPLAVFPMLIAQVVGARVSLKRLQKFFLADELEPYVSAEAPEDTACQIKGGTFQWKRGVDTLNNVNVTVPRGSLTAVVGSIGSGKTSLLSALLGDIGRTEGTVSVSGSVAYMAQQSWIQNATLRDNILGGLDFNDAKYQHTLQVCSLERDLELLTDGDQTEIGERGINLSGGQKARVALARAVYADADIYFLDDPLSAVDSHVGNHIFTKCIQGALKDKTVVLVTHRLDILPGTDHVIVLKDKCVESQGPYDEVVKQSTLLQFGAKQQQDAEDTAKARDEADAEAVAEAPTLDVTDGGGGGGDKGGEKGAGPVKPTDGGSTASDKKAADGDAVNKPAAAAKLMTTEDRQTGSVTLATYTAYAQAVGYTMCWIVLFAGVASQVVKLGTDWWVSHWAAADDAERFKYYLGMYGVWSFSQAFGTWLRDVLLAVSELRAATRLHNRMLKSIMSAPMAFFDTTPMGRILNRFSNDQSVVDETLPRSINSLVFTFLQVAGTLLAIGVITPTFIVALLPLSYLYQRMQQYYRHTSREIKRIEAVARSPFYSHFAETLGGVSTVRAFGWNGRFVDKNRAGLDRIDRVFIPSMAANRWLGIRVEFLGNCIVTSAGVSAVAFAVMNWLEGRASLVGLSLTFALNVTNTLGWMVRMSAEAEANMNAVERVVEYSDVPKEAPNETPNDTPAPAGWPSRGEVKFENVSLRYREGLDLILRDVSFTAPAGMKVGVVGRTGAGKSSLIVALLRIAEVAEGRIMIDGKDISQMRLRDVRRNVAIVPQDPVLFTGTVRYNLDPFDEYTDERIWEVVNEVHLAPAIKELQGGLKAPVAENGENFSTGERQLFCMARALLRRAKIVILDEATAAADVETDALIQTAIRTSCAQCTVLTVAHRLNTIMDYDLVLVLDAGKVKEIASPQDLLKDKNSQFAAMVAESRAATMSTSASNTPRANADN